MKAYDTLIIGTGCAGYNSADWLHTFGITDIAMLTEGKMMGTSRNTGSDKQTYYKLSLSGDGQDSVKDMANTLFSGGCVHGDHALIEAACSVKGFMKLANLGVPFPTNKYGEYVGYKTDHDPRQRGTSSGPLTSKLMTEVLEKSVIEKQIPIYNDFQVVKIIVDKEKVTGLVALDIKNNEFITFSCNNIILATGGPAGIYYTSVYPQSQTGATSLAIEAGAKLSNFSQWQYGLASTSFRWNVSGTYQQVLPKYISIDKNNNKREFLLDYYDNPLDAINMVFLKGYQWPFDTMKINGSSYIDIIIDKEINEKGNKVYMDFRENPTGLTSDFSGLADETYDYLKKSNALLDTPIKRLEKMNKKAIDLYKSNGIDLYNEMLEVAVCAQHCNGGVDVNLNWETNINGLFVVGEAAGTFGVYRPGGSALNSTQVGSLRAAECIAFLKKRTVPKCDYTFIKENVKYGESNVVENRLNSQKLMSKHASYIRDKDKIIDLLEKLKEDLATFEDKTQISSDYELYFYYKNKGILIEQIALLSTMVFSCENIGTRGSALVINGYDGLDKKLDKVVVTNNFTPSFENVREIPKSDDWFENVWNEFDCIRSGN